MNKHIVPYCVWFVMFLLCMKAMPALSQVAAPAIHIEPGDMLDVTVYDSPDLSGHYRVNEKGDVAVPLIGSLHVQGKTADEAQIAIEKKYINSEILKSETAHVVLFVSEYATQGIVIGGEVKSPGVYPSLGVRMLNDLVVQAGGITPLAASQIYIKHRDENVYKSIIDYNPGAMPPLLPNIQVFPGDTIMIPKAGSVFVVGNVNRPGNYILDIRYTMTVKKALAMAEGERGSSTLRKAQLTRSNSDGQSMIVYIDIIKIYQGKSPDIAMRDGDVLYIPRSGKKAAASQAISSMLGMGTSVATYRASYR